VTVVPEIRRDFVADPVDAVRQNAGYHIDAPTLEALAPQVQQIAASRDQQARVADYLWANEDFEFFKLVQGFTGDRTLVDREMGTGGDVPLLQPRPLTDVAARPYVGVAPPENRRPEFTLAQGPEAIAAVLERNRVLGNVDRLMEQPQVSGEMQMSSVLWGAIEEALVTLFMINRDKYEGRTRQHFYAVRPVKVLFAKLVAQIIIRNKMPSDGQFHQIPIGPMRNREVNLVAADLDNTCAWNASRGHFDVARAKKVEENKAQKRMRLLDTYNPSAWNIDN
jgi:hypothetical protein